MSRESAKAFLERMKTDGEFAAQVIACPDAQARLAWVKAAGFDFTQEELDGLKWELDDDELNQVAGGRMVFNGVLEYTPPLHCRTYGGLLDGSPVTQSA